MQWISFQTQELDVKDEGGVRRDDARVTFVSVSVVRRTGQLGSLADAHLEEEGRRRRTQTEDREGDNRGHVEHLEDFVNWIIIQSLLSRVDNKPQSTSLILMMLYCFLIEFLVHTLSLLHHILCSDH